MHCKSLWIKASAKCINVNVNVIFCRKDSGAASYLKHLLIQDTRPEDHDAFGVDDGVRASG